LEEQETRLKKITDKMAIHEIHCPINVHALCRPLP
jgi:hypothetical protein